MKTKSHKLSTAVIQAQDDSGGDNRVNPRVDVDIHSIGHDTKTPDDKQDIKHLQVSILSDLVVEQTGEDETERHTGE